MADIIIHWHLLPSMSELIEELRKRGHRVLFLPKAYSMIRGCIPDIEIIEPPDRFWAGMIVDGHREFLISVLSEVKPDPGVILIDSGGLLTQVFDSLFSGVYRRSIQTTRFGCRGNVSPAVYFGANPRKLAFDQVCCAALVEEASRNFDLSGRIAVCGLGSMGNGLASLLPKCIHLSGLEDECPEVDALFGATGYDISALARSSRAKHLVSCSSWDVEFRSLLLEGDEVLSFSLNNVNVRRGESIIYNGGCPLNFNRKRELEAPEAMRQMRRLVLEETIA